MFALSFEAKAIAALVLVAGLGGWHLWDVHRASSEATAACKASYAAAALAAETTNRAEENRRQDAAHEIDLEAQRIATRSRTAADRAAAAVQRVRIVVAAGASQAASDPTAAAGGSTAADLVALYADVLGRVLDLGGAYAREADTRGDAGATCVGRYNSLTP